MDVGIIILFGIFILTMAMGVPIAFSLIISGIALLLVTGMTKPELLIQTIFSNAENFPLLAIPFFILAGDMMSVGGIAKRLIAFGEAIVGATTGSLGIIAILGSFIFAAISGSGVATAAAIGSIMLPIMKNNGYKPQHSAAIIGIAGALGPIVPPSIMFIVYGVLANVSITKLFIGGVFPGVVIAICLIIVTYIACKKEKYPVSTQKTSLKAILKTINEGKFALLTPIIVLGGIYGGIFTPTEAAVIAVVYCFFVSVFVYKEYGIRDVPKICMRATVTSASILIIMGPAIFFGKLLSLMQVPSAVEVFFKSISTSPIVFLTIVNVFLFGVGMIMEGLAALTILTPILVPIAISYNIDPLHFGIIACVNLSIGLATPPFGLNLYVSSSIAQVPFSSTFSYLLPLIVAAIIGMMLITVIPEISTFLPNIFTQ